MTWKCPECNRVLKKKGKHMDTHKESSEVDFNTVEEYLLMGPQVGGEISRLRMLRQHDTSKDWDSVYHSYAKVGKEDGAQAQTKHERQDLRARIKVGRRTEKW